MEVVGPLTLDLQIYCVGLLLKLGISEDKIKEIASFLSCAYPIGGSFFDYRNTSQENINKFFDFQNNIEESFVFDIEHNTSSLQAMLAEHLGEFTDTESFKKAVLESLQKL